jgi:hypothetical protein
MISTFTSLQRVFLFNFLLILFIGEGLNLNAQTLSVQVVNPTVISCQNDGSASITITGGVGPYTAYWLMYVSSPAQPPIGQNTLDTVAIGTSVNNLAPGYYQIHVYDSSTPTQLMGTTGLSVQGSFQLSQTVTPATCSNADGKIRITALNTVGPYSFEWSTGVQHIDLSSNVDSVSQVAAGTYSCIVTNGNGCFVTGGGAGTTSQGIYVYSTSPITATSSATASNCFDGTATVVAIGGTAPYSYVWNTVPAQFTNTATGLSPGYVICNITDAIGCSRQQYVSIPAGPNYLQATSVISEVVCGVSPGEINMTVTGGVTPYTYNWSNGSTTQDLTGIPAGSYSVVITDGQGCSLTAYKYVPEYSTVQATITSSYPDCSNANGSATVSATGGTAPYTYLWNNSLNTSATVTGLTPGYYYVTATDANGCSDNAYVNIQLPQACRVHIRGRIFNDLNGNCSFDANEGVLPNVLVNAAPGYHYGSTDANGFYDIETDPGTYDLSAYAPNHWEQICPMGPMTINVDASTAGSTYTGNNFYMQPDSIFSDLQVYLYSGPARPGFPLYWYANVRNVGTTTLTTGLQVQHDALATYTGASPAVSSYNPASKVASWSAATLNPHTSNNYQLNTVLSTSAVLGDSVHATASLTYTGPDINSASNTYQYARLISGSYDPNDKAVEPRGLGEEGSILYEDTTLRYTIRFQNTGTDTAFTVVIRDTLDASLDVPSFRLEGSSHSMNYSISGDGVVTFTFNNIQLPDSFVNEPGSHGILSYFINRKMDIPLGTEIQNTAYIYFDFNLPIVTNTTRNTLFDPTLGIKQVSNFNFSLQPNPTTDRSLVLLNLKDAGDVQISMLDVSGRLLTQRHLGKLAAGDHQWQLDSLSAGVYLIRIQAGNTIQTKRLVVTR